MSVYIHEPMNSPKISRKGCQMKIRYRRCKNCAGRLPFSRRLCSPLSARDSAGSHSALVKNPSHHSKPCRVNLEAGRKQPRKYLEQHGYVTSACGSELPAGPRSEPRRSKLSALSTDI